MEEKKDMLILLDKLIQPVFCVKEYRIVQINAAARQLFLQPGEDIRPLLENAQEEYESFQGGCLYLTLTISGQCVNSCVQRIGDLDVFELDTGDDNAALQPLALAARELRKPLGSALFSAAALQEQLNDPKALQQLAQLNQGLHRILRLLGNMTDAGTFAGAFQPETVNIPERIEEIFRSAAYVLERANITLHYEGLSDPIYALADCGQLERAILNILSNAAKFSPKGSSIQASLTRRGRTLRLTVQDNGGGIADEVMSSLFRRYLRQPGIEDSRFGLGLGIRMVHNIAVQHGGTLLVSRGDNGGTRIVMTLAIRQREQNQLRSPIFPIDYSGGYDHRLVELSDVLPAELFDGSF